MATKSFTAQLKAFEELTARQMKVVAAEAIQDVAEAAQTPQIGITKGATSFVEGKIPVAERDLIKSLKSRINGGEVGEGETSYTAAIAGFEVGDRLEFEWTAAHALRMEAGFTGTDELGREYNQAGRHFVGANAAKFSEFVEQRVREVKK